MSLFNVCMCQYDSEFSLLAHVHSQLEVFRTCFIWFEFIHDLELTDSPLPEISTSSEFEVSLWTHNDVITVSRVTLSHFNVSRRNFSRGSVSQCVPVCSSVSQCEVWEDKKSVAQPNQAISSCLGNYSSHQPYDRIFHVAPGSLLVIQMFSAMPSTSDKTLKNSSFYPFTRFNLNIF